MSERIYGFEEFKEKLAQKMQESLPEEYKNSRIEFHEVNKSGIGTVTGMTMRSDHSQIAPCLYIDSAYKEYQQYHLPIENVIDSVTAKFCGALADGQDLAEDQAVKTIMDAGLEWEQAKDLCVLKAVPVTGNEAFLENRPHRIQGDIAAVYQLDLKSTDNYSMTISITDTLAERFGITENQLFEVAGKNMTEQNPPHIIPLESMMMRMLGGAEPPSMGSFQEESAALKESISSDSQFPPLGVLTNENGMNGAGMIFLPEVMDTLSQNFQDGFYILPSSVHEGATRFAA